MNLIKTCKTLFIVYIFYITLPTCIGFAKDKEEHTLDYILTKVEEANKALVSLKAEITITRSIPLLESEDISKGKLTYQKPKRFHLKFLPPRNEINIINGKNIWIYHIDEKQVEKYYMDDIENNAQIGSFLDFGLNESIDIIRNNYEITILAKEKNLYKLKLTPKNTVTGAQYTDINLWIDEDLWVPVSFQLFESNGTINNLIELKNVTINKHVPVKTFEFIAPKDVVVVEPF